MQRAIAIRICLHCHKEFRPRPSTQRFCSKSCARYSHVTLAEHAALRIRQCDHGNDCEICCWEWQGWTNKDGYGEFEYHDKLYRPHVVAYMISAGLPAIPYKMCVCHQCDFPACCNPNHLWLGTQKENIQDASRKGRLTNRLKGEKHLKAKLSSADVQQIRILREQGWMYKDIHDIFPHVNRSTIQNIGKGKTRRHG